MEEHGKDSEEWMSKKEEWIRKMEGGRMVGKKKEKGLE